MSPSSQNSEQIAAFRAFLSDLVRPRVADTADSDTVLSTPSGENVGRRGCDGDSETELTRDVRSKGVESNDNFRDCISRIFIIANNRLDVVANLLTYVTYHYRVNTEVPSVSRL